MTQNQQRFSGRELADLLAQVRSELGEDATIVEANRFRQGGIGGFFAKERYEVVATVADADADADEPAHDAPGTTSAVGTHAAGWATGAATAFDPVEGLLDRADRVSTGEQLAAGASTSAARAAARPVDDDVDEARFQEILRTALVDLAEPEAPRAAAPAPPAPAPEPLAPAAAPERVRGAAPPPSHRVLEASVDASEHPVRPTVHAAPPSASASQPFWDDVERWDRLVDGRGLDGRITALVGPLRGAVPLARRLAAWTSVEPGDVLVVSGCSGIDGVPPWQVVDQRDALAERVRYWRGHGHRAVVVIGLEDDRDLGPVSRHLATMGADVVRLAVADLSQPAELAHRLRAIGPVAALDITAPPDPSALLQLVESGVRVATVCGRRLTAELLAGLAAHARGC